MGSESLRLPEWDKVVRGEISNGVRYVIIPHATPPNRLYAHLHVGVGSAAEAEDQQGIAHFVEHQVFNGTDAYPSPEVLRELLSSWGMSFGGDANAYTDFGSTVYTLDAPVEKSVIAAFAKSYEFSDDSETDEEDAEEEEEEEEEEETPPCDLPEEDAEEDLLRKLEHFGLQRADMEAIDEGAACSVRSERNIWKVLHVLKELVFSAKMEEATTSIERGAVLGELREGNTVDHRSLVAYFSQIFEGSLLPRRFPIGLEEQIKAFTSEDLLRFYKTHYTTENATVFLVGVLDVQEARMCIENIFGGLPRTAARPIPPALKPGFDFAPVQRFKVFTHELESQFELTFTCLLPLQPVRVEQDLRQYFLKSILLETFDSRICTVRERLAHSPFESVDWSMEGEGNQGCTLCTLTILARPSRWRDAVQCAVKEAIRLATDGIGKSEYNYVRSIIRKFFEQAAEQASTTSSDDVLEEALERYEEGSVMMSAKEMYARSVEVLPQISLEEVNAAFAAELNFVCCFDQPDALRPGCSVFVKAPASIERELTEEAIAATIGRARQLSREGESSFLDIPSFLVDKRKLAERVACASVAYVQPSVADRIEATWKGELEQLDGEHLPDDMPRFVSGTLKGVPLVVDLKDGVQMLELSNGLRLNLKHTDFEAKQCRISIHGRGGMLTESARGCLGASALGFEALVDGDVPHHPAETISKYVRLHALYVDARAGLDNWALDIDFGTSGYGLQRALEVCHVLASVQELDSKAFERARESSVSDCKRRAKDIEGVTHECLWQEVFQGSEGARFRDRTLAELLDASCERASQHLRELLQPRNLIVNIVGDFGTDVTDLVLTYLGSLVADGAVQFDPLGACLTPPATAVAVSSSGASYRHIMDEAERAFVVLAFPGMNRRGQCSLKPSSLEVEPRNSLQAQPAFALRAAGLLHVIINNRLYREVREKKGLVYNASCDWKIPQFLGTGFITVELSPVPARVAETVELVLRVLHGIKAKGVDDAELQEALMPMVARRKTSLHDNSFWSSRLFMQQDPSADLELKLGLPADVCPYSEFKTEDLAFFIQNYPVLLTDMLTVSIGTSGKEASEQCLEDVLRLRIAIE